MHGSSFQDSVGALVSDLRGAVRDLQSLGTPDYWTFGEQERAATRNLLKRTAQEVLTDLRERHRDVLVTSGGRLMPLYKPLLVGLNSAELQRYDIAVPVFQLYDSSRFREQCATIAPRVSSDSEVRIRQDLTFLAYQLSQSIFLFSLDALEPDERSFVSDAKAMSDCYSRLSLTTWASYFLGLSRAFEDGMLFEFVVLSHFGPHDWVHPRLSDWEQLSDGAFMLKWCDAADSLRLVLNRVSNSGSAKGIWQLLYEVASAIISRAGAGCFGRIMRFQQVAELDLAAQLLVAYYRTVSDIQGIALDHLRPG